MQEEKGGGGGEEPFPLPHTGPREESSIPESLKELQGGWILGGSGSRKALIGSCRSHLRFGGSFGSN